MSVRETNLVPSRSAQQLERFFFLSFLIHTKKALQLACRVPRRFFEIFTTTRLKSNICGGDDGAGNDGHKLWQSQCETTAKISSGGDMGRSD